MEASVSEAADAFASEAGVQAPPLVDSAALREALQLTGQAARAWARVAAPLVQHAGKGAVSVTYTHLTLPTILLV